MPAFRKKYPIRFGDIDHAGILFYPRFFTYFHQAFEDFFTDTDGDDYPYILDTRKIGFPAVHIEADFRAPFAYGDDMRIELSMKRIGTKSITFLFRAFRNDEDDVCAEATITKAMVDMTNFKAIWVPDDLRGRFEAILEDGS